MRVFERKPKATLKILSASPAIPRRAQVRKGAGESPILHLQRTIGNRATRRLLSVGRGAWGAMLQRQPVAETPRFTPTKFSNGEALIKAVVKDHATREDLVGACYYLDAQTMAGTLALVRQIAAHNRAAVEVLQATALQGYGISQVRLALAALQFKGQISRVGFAAEQESDLQALPAADAKQVLDVIGPAVPELEEMAKSKGFQALKPEERTQLNYLIGGSTTVSAGAARALRAVLADRHANKDDPATFRKFLTDEKYLQPDVGLPQGKVRPADPFTIGTATDVANYAFGGIPGLAADALRYEVVVNAKDANGKDVKLTIPVFIPKTAGVKDKAYVRPTIAQAAALLASAPDISRSKIVHVDVHWLPNNTAPDGGKPWDDAETAMAAGADGVVNIYPQKSTAHDPATLGATLIHETGHTASLKAWGEVKDKRWDPWRAAMKSDGMAASQYAKATTDEDFAESWALYVPVVGTPRQNEVRGLIPARCKLMDTLLW